MVKPDFKFEKEALENGYGFVVGVDEVGRGALAGPVVAAATLIFNYQFPIFNNIGIDDSKRLTAIKREKLAKIIKENAVWGIGEASVSYINRRGIVKATEKAMRKAISNLKFEIRNSKTQRKVFLLIDAFSLRYVPHIGLKKQKAIIKGDQKSISIAAASIIAKVYRDEVMTNLHKEYPKYGWGNSKGYGTEKHWQAIKKFGICRLHRKKFVESGLSH